MNHQIHYISVSIDPVSEHSRSVMSPCSVQGARAILATIFTQRCKITKTKQAENQM